MPEAHFQYDEADRALLDRIRERLQLSSRDEAAEWLVKARLRRAAMKLTGRGRALYPVGRGER
ncbi:MULTISPECIES: hypothetical protein [Pseudomonadaceae]|jgi:hypothetical protein|uniref:Uncharacterized protein n=1 Tax=Pseudomonas abyssi TaxID=170540 RepID=A0A395R2R7_9PSED|nr:hypothetical protein [Halopseudomonas gallaeciensis]RGP54396.1 hypothetical protein ASB58_10980 [Halopseudomonas gallaeciensis]